MDGTADGVVESVEETDERGLPRPGGADEGRDLTGRKVEVDPAQSRWVAVHLQLPYTAAGPGSHPIHFNVGTVNGDAHVSEKSVFLVPR